MQPARFFTPLIRVFTWYRRWFAALFAVLAVVAGLNAIAIRSSGAVPVVVTSTTIAAGATVGAGQLTITWLPADLVAEGAFTDIDAVAGAEAVVSLPARTVITPALLFADRPAVSAGKVALPVQFSQSSATGLISVGSRLDVLGSSASGSGFSVIAANVRVIAQPTATSSSPLGGGDASVVLIEVDQAQAVAITMAAGSGLSFALR